MGHARATDVYDCALESAEDTLRYKIIVQLLVDGPMSIGHFSTSLKKRNFKKDLVGSCSFHKLCNAFLRKSSAVWIAYFFKALFQLYHKTPVTIEVKNSCNTSIETDTLSYFFIQISFFTDDGIFTGLAEDFLQWCAMCKNVFQN